MPEDLPNLASAAVAARAGGNVELACELEAQMLDLDTQGVARHLIREAERHYWDGVKAEYGLSFTR